MKPLAWAYASGFSFWGEIWRLSPSFYLLNHLSTLSEFFCDSHGISRASKVAAELR